MFVSKFRSWFADPDGTPVLVRRLLAEQARGHASRYVLAFVLMSFSAACTAIAAYLIKNVVNESYLNHNFRAVLTLSLVTMLPFVLKGLSTYGYSVTMARIGARIIAQNQRRMFDKLLNEGLSFFADRHSTEFIARLTTGANSAWQVLNLLINAIGRDVLSLIGLATVMVIQDPIMFFLGIAVVPPAMIVLRKMVRRIRVVALKQFTGGTRILETMQEAVQGIRIVKAFTLEDEMRRRFERSVDEVQHESMKMARIANRTSPLMESLAGAAIALVVMYSGYRVIYSGATAGEFMSFLASFLLAFEPAKRLARLNVELNSGLVGVRVLFEVIDSAPTEPIDSNETPLVLTSAARIEFRDVHFAYHHAE